MPVQREPLPDPRVYEAMRRRDAAEARANLDRLFGDDARYPFLEYPETTMGTPMQRAQLNEERAKRFELMRIADALEQITRGVRP